MKFAIFAIILGVVDASTVTPQLQSAQPTMMKVEDVKNRQKKTHRKLSKTYFRIRRKLVEDLRQALTPVIFMSWKDSMMKKGIPLSKLTNEDLRKLLIDSTTVPAKDARKLMAGGDKVVESGAINTYIKELTGGNLSVRLPNLPQVVMVNQSPYYQYLRV